MSIAMPLAFTVVLVLLYIKEQILVYLSLLVLGLGVVLAGVFSSELGLLCTPFMMSIGFHFMEVLRQSLSLQWLPKEEASDALDSNFAE